MGLFRFDSTKIKIMLMPKKNLVAIYEHLFREGVMVAKKDTHAPKHPELEAVPNLQVIKALTSLKSRGYVKEQRLVLMAIRLALPDLDLLPWNSEVDSAEARR